MLQERYEEKIEMTMKTFFETLSEKDRRRYAAVEALKLGNGGQQYICEILGCDPRTVRRGTVELREDFLPDDRIRQLDGCRKKITETIENIGSSHTKLKLPHTLRNYVNSIINAII